MKKRGFLLGTVGAALAFGLLIVGCASAPRDPGSAAVKLAAEINAIKAGSAKTSGGTVALTGGLVEVEKRLTVPEGVTLDLTADGAALELRDGAVLTVNGTINAAGYGGHDKGWGSLRVDDGAAVIAGTGTISLKSKGRLLNIGGGKGRCQLTLDGITLVGLPDNDSPLVGTGENGGFILKSGAITGNTNNSNTWAGGGGVFIGEEAVFTMSGGAITDNSAANGGGVNVGRGTFTMEGGEISDNTAQGNTDHNNYGGGVYVGGEDSRFVMKNGAITGNTATSGRYDQGGGVYVEGGDNPVTGGVSFIMEGGTISGNSAQGRIGANAGGVVIYQASFIMSGGEITGNSTQGTEAKGGGVRVSGDVSSFVMTGGAISGNSAQGSDLCFGGGVYITDDAVFTMSGGRIQGCTDSDGFTKNILTGNNQRGAALHVDRYLPNTTAKWGTGGTYTRGGVSQSGGSDIGDTDDTLIAIPGQ
jgi:hypothetical protein